MGGGQSSDSGKKSRRDSQFSGIVPDHMHPTGGQAYTNEEFMAALEKIPLEDIDLAAELRAGNITKEQYREAVEYKKHHLGDLRNHENEGLGLRASMRKFNGHHHNEHLHAAITGAHGEDAAHHEIFAKETGIRRGVVTHDDHGDVHAQGGGDAHHADHDARKAQMAAEYDEHRANLKSFRAGVDQKMGQLAAQEAHLQSVIDSHADGGVHEDHHDVLNHTIEMKAALEKARCRTEAMGDIIEHDHAQQTANTLGVKMARNPVAKARCRTMSQAEIKAIHRDSVVGDSSLTHIMKVLKRIYLFQLIKDDELETYAKAFTLDHFKAEDKIIEEGGAADHMYVVERGVLDKVHYGERTETLGPGDFVGEIALIHNLPHEFDVIAAEDSMVWKLERIVFRRLCANDRVQENMKRARLLAGVPILSGLTDDHIDHIAAALTSETFTTPGQLVAAKDDHQHRFMLVENGSITAEHMPAWMSEKRGDPGND